MPFGNNERTRGQYFLLYVHKCAYINTHTYLHFNTKMVILCLLFLGFLLAQTVKNLPAMQETWVWFLGWEDPLEEGLATHSRILAWIIPWTEEPGGLPSIVTKNQTQLNNWAQHAIWCVAFLTHQSIVDFFSCPFEINVFMAVEHCLSWLYSYLLSHSSLDQHSSRLLPNAPYKKKK